MLNASRLRALECVGGCPGLKVYRTETSVHKQHDKTTRLSFRAHQGTSTSEHSKQALWATGHRLVSGQYLPDLGPLEEPLPVIQLLHIWHALRHRNRGVLFLKVL